MKKSFIEHYKHINSNEAITYHSKIRSCVSCRSGLKVDPTSVEASIWVTDPADFQHTQ